MQDIIRKNLEEIRNICASLNVKKLYVFGSASKGSFRPDSDIDLLVSFNENLSFEDYADNYFELHYRLRDLLHREIDIVTERSLHNPYFIQNVNKTKKLIYEA